MSNPIAIRVQGLGGLDPADPEANVTIEYVADPDDTAPPEVDPLGDALAAIEVLVSLDDPGDPLPDDSPLVSRAKAKRQADKTKPPK